MHHNSLKRISTLLIAFLYTASAFATPVYADFVTEDPAYLTTEEQNDWNSDFTDLSQGHTVDKVRTSDTYYRTIGYTVSECIPGTMNLTGVSYDAQVYNTFNLTQNGKQYNTFGTSYEDFVNKATASWQQNYYAAKYGSYTGDYYIRLDCIMVVYENGNIIRNPDGSIKLFRNYNSIANAEPWANKNGLKTHFNKYIKITKSKKGEAKTAAAISEASTPGDDIYDYHITHDSTKPIEYHEGNSSPAGFDIGTGIPTTETLKNEYDATSWYAETDVRVKVKYWPEYSKNVSYNFPYWDGTYEQVWVSDSSPEGGHYEDDKNKPIIRSEPWGHGAVDFESEFMDQYWQMIPIVSYQYVANTLGLDFTTAEVRNKTFEGGRITYSSSKTIEATCISTNNYVDAAGSGNSGALAGKDWYSVPSTDETVNGNWMGNDDAHIRINGTLPKVEDYVPDSEITVGGGPGPRGSYTSIAAGREACEKYHKGQRLSCRNAF